MENNKNECFACGRGFSQDVKSVLLRYQEDFIKNGNKRVYYKLSENGDIKITGSKEFFKTIKPKQFTKKAIKDGANFALIQEFGNATDTVVLGNSEVKKL
jgi:hypothetical protein